MFASIVSYGLAVGAVYALIGITYNVMFSASRVFSFTAGMLGMLGGVLGALFIQRMGMNAALGFVLVLACGAVLGLVTEILTVRPVLKSIEQHLYVLSTLAFALMVQQVTAVEWGTEAQPFPPVVPVLLWAGLCTLRGHIVGLWAGTFLAGSGLAATTLGITGVLFDEGIFGDRLMRLPLFSLLMLIALVGLLLHIVALISRRHVELPQR